MVHEAVMEPIVTQASIQDEGRDGSGQLRWYQTLVDKFGCRALCCIESTQDVCQYGFVDSIPILITAETKIDLDRKRTKDDWDSGIEDDVMDNFSERLRRSAERGNSKATTSGGTPRSGDDFVRAETDLTSDGMHGLGDLIMEDGSIYVGNFCMGRFHGYGKCTSEDGSTSYQGQWVHGAKHGFITYRSAEGFVYRGEWRADVMNGPGTLTIANGDVSSGTFMDGVLQGPGRVLSSTKKLLYQGQFQNSVHHGSGTYYYPDGRVYDGQWDNGDMHGTGVMHWKDGAVYDGTFTNGWLDGAPSDTASNVEFTV